jgi:hypothetical protein
MGDMSDGYALDPAQLAAASAALGDVQDGLASQAAALELTPDAGASSTEVAGAFAALAGELTAVAQAVGAMATAVEQSRASYQSTDSRVGTGYEGMMGR